MNDDILTAYTPLDEPYQELDIIFMPTKINWIEAKEQYVSDPTLTYYDIANRYNVSLKQVKKWGARQEWRKGRQEVSELAQIKLTENLAETAAETNLRHAKIYQQTQELISTQIETITTALGTPEYESEMITDELLTPASLLRLTRDLTAAVNGERVCLGLPTKIESARVGWKPPVQDD